MKNISGSCLCEQVQFTCKDSFTEFHFCHCIQCQKATGSAHVSNLFTAPDNIDWLAGEQFIKRYDVPNRSISTAFCNECGSPVPYVTVSGQSLIVPAGALNDSPTLMPQDNIFWHEKAEWYKQGLDAKKIDGFPDIY